MQDLNDLRLFVEVVNEGGFAAAARKLGIPRSRISRRIGLLEERLGVRLVQRSTRHFAVTDIGHEYYGHCLAMAVEAEAAQEAIDRIKAEPQGTVRVSCPSSVIYFQLGDILARFMAACPKVTVLLESTNRRVDVMREGFDIAIRVRFPPLEDSELMIRKLAISDQRLVAAPRGSRWPDASGTPRRPCQAAKLGVGAIEARTRVETGRSGRRDRRRSPCSPFRNRGHGRPSSRSPSGCGGLPASVVHCGK